MLAMVKSRLGADRPETLNDATLLFTFHMLLLLTRVVPKVDIHLSLSDL